MTAQPVVGVLALQGDVREHAAALTACDVQVRPVRRVEELDGLHGIVLPGGESTTMSRLLETFELLQPLKTRIADGLPAYGSCAGMIMLATKVLDGRPDQHQLDGIDMIVRRNAFGRQVDSFEEGLEFDGIESGPLHAVFIRAPWVESVSPDVEVLATVPDTETAGPAAGRIVAVRQRSVLATAFHPELTGDGRVHRLFTEIVRAS
ncbi:pyridoxal 5'-phosphate synthase glutaminase subunit PdxT [Kibdelosporangium philippinense]|uniref:Pyridoxal 5'-phosphate synthase subunit PdxT n=1 Tax=Kibdelosporangium philippinense TaxID=211113 RepID=A0ABS8ZS66_9PSEU|nr:pyridoxal 5'-phosphate synthase glutaminase subunit PdxT [Kibdelosporangium philippinense]MCE7010517.1 pyridoxal 5'-phosphate synthase glutaminase subunit PdxT [Kibdelosporangium philippinense]